MRALMHKDPSSSHEYCEEDPGVALVTGRILLRTYGTLRALSLTCPCL